MAMRRRVGNRLEHVEQRNRASYPNEYKPSGAQANDLVTERGQTGTTELRRSQESQEQVKEARTLKITRRKEKKNDRANFYKASHPWLASGRGSNRALVGHGRLLPSAMPRACAFRYMYVHT